MWGVIYVAHYISQAEKIIENLEDNGIIARRRQVLKSNNSDGLIEIIVEEDDIEDAYEIISSM
ncbi:hypothetical protein [Clostridium cylindrosporum]|uniref:DUF2007 domain-containing protein n=1 Tax=Clostridium cylindrosporum DSM 605 TaxID=1121307 RepID=A0A0J8D9S8_CLOCY|nr:hypothetical protein [Clostridium cylindrosporum]KMT21059.1 hypothetical protein CLCY_1c02930 [Clostridium cylindrosporum DSM 605]